MFYREVPILEVQSRNAHIVAISDPNSSLAIFGHEGNCIFEQPVMRSESQPFAMIANKHSGKRRHPQPSLAVD